MDKNRTSKNRTCCIKGFTLCRKTVLMALVPRGNRVGFELGSKYDYPKFSWNIVVYYRIHYSLWQVISFMMSFPFFCFKTLTVTDVSCLCLAVFSYPPVSISPDYALWLYVCVSSPWVRVSVSTHLPLCFHCLHLGPHIHNTTVKELLYHVYTMFTATVVRDYYYKLEAYSANIAASTWL